MTQRPFNKSADANKDVILEQLRLVLPVPARVLEIGSGTGQHGSHFTGEIPELEWQTSDRDLETYGLAAAISEVSNMPEPIVLDVAHWPALRPRFDAVYSANCVHLMDARDLPHYVAGAARSLLPDGVMILYGPFKYRGEFTTDSNERFDTFLKAQHPSAGIRDFEVIDRLAGEEGLRLEKDVAMPSNNQFLVWRKGGAKGLTRL